MIGSPSKTKTKTASSAPPIRHATSTIFHYDGNSRKENNGEKLLRPNKTRLLARFHTPEYCTAQQGLCATDETNVRRNSDACPCCRGLNPVAVAFDVRARRGKADRLLARRFSIPVVALTRAQGSVI